MSVSGDYTNKALEAATGPKKVNEIVKLGLGERNESEENTGLRYNH